MQLPYTVADSDYVIMMCLSQMGRENDRPCIFYDLQVTSKDVPLVEIKYEPFKCFKISGQLLGVPTNKTLTCNGEF